MEAFKRDVESRLDRSDEKIGRMADSVEALAGSVNKLVERDIRNQEREDRQGDFNNRIVNRLEKVEGRQEAIKEKLGIGLFKIGLVWSAGGVLFTAVIAMAFAYLKTQGVDLKP